VEVTAAGTASVVPTPGLSLDFPFGGAVDAQGDLFIADSVHSRIVEVEAGRPAPPVATSSTSLLSSNATSVAPSGSGFDSNPANDRVTFDHGVAGTVVSATSTSLTVRLSGLGSLAAGTALDASVSVDGVSSSTVPVATVANPTVTTVTTSVAQPTYGQA